MSCLCRCRLVLLIMDNIILRSTHKYHFATINPRIFCFRFWLICCFTALQHYHCHFECGQLAYSHYRRFLKSLKFCYKVSQFWRLDELKKVISLLKSESFIHIEALEYHVFIVRLASTSEEEMLKSVCKILLTINYKIRWMLAFPFAAEPFAISIL